VQGRGKAPARDLRRGVGLPLTTGNGRRAPPGRARPGASSGRARR
jgi:hypothetical protein